jgi:hypothetical protein
MIPPHKYRIIKFLTRHKHHLWVGRLRDYLLVRWRRLPIEHADELLWEEMIETMSHSPVRPRLAKLDITVDEPTSEPRLVWSGSTPIGKIQTLLPDKPLGVSYEYRTTTFHLKEPE